MIKMLSGVLGAGQLSGRVRNDSSNLTGKSTGRADHQGVPTGLIGPNESHLSVEFTTYILFQPKSTNSFLMVKCHYHNCQDHPTTRMGNLSSSSPSPKSRMVISQKWKDLSEIRWWQNDRIIDGHDQDHSDFGGSWTAPKHLIRKARKEENDCHPAFEWDSFDNWHSNQRDVAAERRRDTKQQNCTGNNPMMTESNNAYISSKVTRQNHCKIIDDISNNYLQEDNHHENQHHFLVVAYLPRFESCLIFDLLRSVCVHTGKTVKQSSSSKTVR